MDLIRIVILYVLNPYSTKIRIQNRKMRNYLWKRFESLFLWLNINSHYIV